MIYKTNYDCFAMRSIKSNSNSTFFVKRNSIVIPVCDLKDNTRVWLSEGGLGFRVGGFINLASEIKGMTSIAYLTKIA